MPIFPSFPARRVLGRTRRETDAATNGKVRRHFFSEPGFQTYASFFALWGGWATAGHCLTETDGAMPPWVRGGAVTWPDGLDAALIGCELPRRAPAAPRLGQRVVATGFPAGSTHLAERTGAVYHERAPGHWIVQMDDGEEPVVTGMSGGPVRDAATGAPLGILITRNSPADLDADGDADESYDFIGLRDVWTAVRKTRVA